jgi:hypothetical protein
MVSDQHEQPAIRESREDNREKGTKKAKAGVKKPGFGGETTRHWRNDASQVKRRVSRNDSSLTGSAG